VGEIQTKKRLISQIQGIKKLFFCSDFPHYCLDLKTREIQTKRGNRNKRGDGIKKLAKSKQKICFLLFGFPGFLF
jgi:hypothetical protein